MRELLSKAGYVVMPFIFSDKPSKYIPFKGEFPVLDRCHYNEFNTIVKEREYVDECPDWMQEAINKGLFMQRLNNAFLEHLNTTGLFDKWKQMKSSDKATELVRFLDTQCLDLSSLNI